VEIERGDFGVTVLEAAGELRHWSERRIASRAAGRDDIRGMYDVGDGAYIDLSEVRPLEVELWPTDPNHLDE
jgi:hypothetical protein